MKIVYESNAGHTKRYADMLSNELKIESISLKEYKITDEPIIFMGWVFGDNICGFDKVRNCNLECVVAVGMSFESKENTEKIISKNNINKQFFYLQGGVDVSKLKGIKKMMLKMVGNSVVRTNKPEDKGIIDMFVNGKDCVKKEKLDEIMAYIKSKINNF